MNNRAFLPRLWMGPLALCAALRALWILARPHPRAGSLVAGWKGRTDLASRLLAAGLLAILRGSLMAQEPQVLCYDMSPPLDRVALRPPTLPELLKMAWRTLDPTKGEEFKQQVVSLQRRGLVSQDAGNLLILAYQQLATHKRMTEGGITCYKMSQAGVALRASRESLLRETELLAKARRGVWITKDTADRAAAAIARELLILEPASKPPVAQEAAERIVELERDV